MSGTHYLGFRAFFLFLGKYIKFPLILLAIVWLAWWKRDLVPEDPASYRIYADFILRFLWVLWAGILAFVMLRSFLDYRSHSYRFDDEFFHIARGYFTKDETGIVYHQIQRVSVKRGILDRAVGVGHLIITMTVSSSDEAGSNKVVLPALDRRKAFLVQKELLKKASQSLQRPLVTARSLEGEEEEEESEE